MIESCALFFALVWLALLVRYLNRRDWKAAIGALAAGCFAVIGKATTFPAVAVIGCGAIAISIGRSWFVGEPKGQLLRLIAVTAIVVGMPFAIGIGWVAYTDAIKTANEFGRMFTSVALEQWNFGTFQQRISGQLFDTVRWRVTPDILGALYPVAFVVLGAILTSTKTLVIGAAALLGFVVPFLVFTNLHIVHNYYQAANALFLVAAVGLGIGRIFDCSQRGVALLLIGGNCGGSAILFLYPLCPVYHP